MNNFLSTDIPGAYEAGNRISKAEAHTGIEVGPPRPITVRSISSDKIKLATRLFGVAMLVACAHAPVAQTNAGGVSLAAGVTQLRKLHSSQVDPDVAKQFAALRDEWLGDPFAQMAAVPDIRHSAYRKIVAMGTAVVPLLVKELANLTGHWHHALEEITGIDPLSEDDCGHLVRIASRWSEWYQS